MIATNDKRHFTTPKLEELASADYIERSEKSQGVEAVNRLRRQLERLTPDTIIIDDDGCEITMARLANRHQQSQVSEARSDPGQSLYTDEEAWHWAVRDLVFFEFYVKDGTQPERIAALDGDEICRIIHQAGFPAIVEQTGGGVATIYAGHELTNPKTKDPYYPCVAGPGWFSEPVWKKPKFHASEFAYAHDSYGPEPHAEDRCIYFDKHATEASVAATIIAFIKDRPKILTDTTIHEDHQGRETSRTTKTREQRRIYHGDGESRLDEKDEDSVTIVQDVLL